MKEQLNDLKRILAMEADLHEALLQQAEAKRGTIIRGDIEGLEGILAQEQELIQAVELLEVERIPLVKKMGAATGIAEPVKLMALLERVEVTQRNAITKIHIRLKDVIQKLRYRTRQNGELMKASMEHVDAFLRTVAEACAPKTGYGSDGQKCAGAHSLLDRKA